MSIEDIDILRILLLSMDKHIHILESKLDVYLMSLCLMNCDIDWTDMNEID